MADLYEWDELDEQLEEVPPRPSLRERLLELLGETKGLKRWHRDETLRQQVRGAFELEVRLVRELAKLAGLEPNVVRRALHEGRASPRTREALRRCGWLVSLLPPAEDA